GLDRLARLPRPDRRPRPAPTPSRTTPRSDVEAARAIAATAARSLDDIRRAREQARALAYFNRRPA
ncbi:MAG: hypothetical protein MUE79_06535, partial [Nitratireductor sp.]|nr:hypothetical protein [Nitratireductor sp.]